jgi:16S rRNA (uracil1498-N3)-methyltransferase
MRIPRIYVDTVLETGTSCLLPADAAHHVINVLRMKIGQPLKVFDGQGGYHDAMIRQIGKREVRLEVHTHHAEEREPPLRITLAQGISRGERMDYTLQKAVELGVHRIVPVLCRYANIRLDAAGKEKRHAHWKKIVISACEQCGRNRIPVLFPAQEFDHWIARDTNPLKLLLHTATPQQLTELHVQTQDLTLLAGPEGGFDDIEVAAAEKSGYRAVRLGPRILRTETAALAALTACQVLWGDLR